MKNILLQLLVFTLIFVSTNLFADDMDKLFYWSNANGLVKASNCKIESFRNPKLAFAKTTLFSRSISLERDQGDSGLTIAAGSIVKLGEIEHGAGKRVIQIVGVNAENVALETEGVKGDSGIVNSKNIESISKRFIQIKNDYPNIPAGSYWKSFGKNKFLKLNCPNLSTNNDYIIFNVYPENGGRMIARVGVSSSETELFKNIQTYKESKIYNKFSDIATDESNSISEINSLPESTKINSDDATPSTKSELTSPADPDVSVTVIPTNDESQNKNEEVSTQIGIDTMICTDQKYINVRNEDLSEVLFTVKNGDRVKTFQGWGENKIEGVIDGKKYEFIKVEFLDSEDITQKVGYVVVSFIEAKSNCIYDPSYRDSLKPENTTFTGLDDKDCCNFPTMQKVTDNFTEGMRRFGGSRGRGTRNHAAVDLYRYKNEPLFSVAPGVVIRSLYFFYQDTFALEIMHSGGFVVRYGELSGKMVNNVSIGKQVKMGDRIGYMGKVSSGCCEAMLHFELYSGKLRGPLTQDGAEVGGVLYNRRRDLIDPTPYMLKWQNEKF